MPATVSVFLNVTDMQRSLAFYRSLGFDVLKEYPDDDGKTAWADLAFDGADFGLGHIASNDDPAFREWVATPLGAGVLVYFTVADVDKIHQAAQKAKATIEMPLTDRPYGRMFTLNDPDGYTVSFLAEPKPVKKLASRARKSLKKAVKGAKQVAKKATPTKGAKTPARKGKAAKTRR